MQLLELFLAAVALTTRQLKWTQALGMVAAISLVSPTTAQSISGTFQCQSIVINIATGPNNLAVGFTTPSFTAGGNPQLPLNGEFEYHPGNINLYQSYWLMYQGNQLADLGLVGIGGPSLLPDSDANGIPNFAERSLAANVSASLVTVSSVTGSSAAATIILNRGAGQTTGSSVTRFTTGAIFTGSWVIPLNDVAGSYNASQRTIQLRSTSSVFTPGNITGTYQVNSDDSVTMSNIILQLDSGNRLTATPVTYTRFGSTYRAIIEFIDGNLSTSYPDFRRWTLQLTDPADNDGDGIPNLSDSTPYGAPPVVVTQPIGATRTVGQSVTFLIGASGSGSLSYQWYLNGNPIAGANTSSYTLPAVALADAGSYTAEVSNSAGSVTSTSAVLTVNPVIILPAISGQPQSLAINQGQSAEFTVTATGSSLGYQWFKDGQNVAGATASVLRITSTQVSDGGVYRVVVSNSAGSETSSPALLSVNSPPSFSDLQPIAVGEGSNLSIQLKTTDSDLPAQNLTVRLVSGLVGLTVSPQGLVLWTPTEAQGGSSYSVAVEVSDGFLSTTGQFEVTVLEVNRPPVINSVAATSVAEGAAWSQALVASDPDLPANGLTFWLVSGPSGASVDSKSGVLSWTPSETDGGRTVDFVVEVADDGQPSLASQTTVQLTVTEVNNPPTLAALADVTVPEETAWSITVRATDSDLPAQALAYGLKTNPSGMTLDANTGEFRWTPSESQGPGTYLVTLSVADAVGATAERSFTVTVTEVNQPPQVAAWAAQRIVFGQSVNLKMDVTDADLPANRLTYQMVEGPSNLVLAEDGRLAWTPARNQAPSTNLISVAVSDGTVSVTNSVSIEVFELVELPVIVTQPVASAVNAGATVAFSVVVTGTAPLSYQWRRNGGDLIGETKASLTLPRVQAANAGDYSVVVGNSAGSVTSVIAALTVNTPPAFVGIKAASVAEGSELSVQLVAADADLPAQKLTVRLIFGPTGLSVSSQGLVSWIPTEAQGPMPYTVKVEVSDGSLTATNEFIVTVTEVNRPPVINPAAATSVAEGTAWFQTLTAADHDLPANGLMFRLVSGPSGASVDSKSGILSWTPSERDGGSTVNFVIEVADDGQPPMASQTTVRLTVTEVNSPPTLEALANVTVPEGAAWSITVRATDSDLPAQALAYLLKANPPGMTLDANTGELRWTPLESQGPGTYPVTLSVADAGGATAERSFTVTVTEVNQPPQVAAWADQRILFGQTVSLKMDVTDADLPANRLTYRIVGGPSNLLLAEDGRLVWTPARNQAPSTNLISVAVSDGTISVTNSVSIEVFELVMAVNGTEATEAINAPLNPWIKFRCGKPDWLVFYSLSGQTPTSDAPSKFYQDPFILSATATVWPIAFSPDFSDSILGVPLRVTVLKAQTLTVEGGFGLVHLGPGVPIEGKSDSGLPVTLAVISGPARLEGGRLVSNGGGVVRLRATQAGNDNWAPAQAEFERTVARAAQTLVWQSLNTAVFGAAPLRLQAIPSSGLLVEYIVVSGPGSVTGDLLQLNGVGTVVLRARQAGSADFEAAVTDLSVPVAKAAQTLVWDGVTDRAFSSEVIPLTGKASSGLGVIYEVISGPAAVNNDRLTLTGVGAVVMRASQAGDANYEAAPVRQVSFVVSKAAQTLAFGPIGSKTFGDGPVTLSATSSAGLPVTYSVVSGPGSLAGNQLSLTGAGEVVLKASQAGNELYQAASVAQTVTVAKAAQLLSWSPDSGLTYRTNLIALDAKASSGLAVGYRVVSGPGVIMAGQISLTGVGSVVIAVEQGGDANWLAATAITNRFTVGRGVQVVTFEPIGDQTFGAGPVMLAARASSGLPVTFSVINGQAAVNDQQLTLLGEGSVTVRAINPGSPLWLSASADQTFTVRLVETQPQVVIDPPKPDGTFSLEIRAPAGVNLALETTSDLNAWTETQRITGQGSSNPVKITLQTDPNVQSKFWRVRVR